MIESATPAKRKARVIAFYLPQYHPIPENDEWWGKGFTEWTVVTRAKPLYRGHHQPNLPGELGFYDLRVPEVRAAQAALAAEHGVEGFCYWHYWMGGGRRLLERPFNDVLNSGEPDFPFCLGWANHSWQGNFFGAGDRMLIEQTYPGEEDFRAHFRWLLRAFEDKRYITVDGKPLLHIYRPFDIPDVARLTDLWRTMAEQAGLKGLYLVGAGLGSRSRKEYGFDASVNANHRAIEKHWPHYAALREFRKRILKGLRRPSVFGYKAAAQYFMPTKKQPWGEIPCVVPNWDTTPRYGNRAFVLRDADPTKFGEQLSRAVEKMSSRPDQEKIVFIRSWNEWAEGNYLEPDTRYGRGWLEAVKSQIINSSPLDAGVQL